MHYFHVLNNYFVRCPLHLIIKPILLFIDSIVLSIASLGKSSIVCLTLFEKFSKCSCSICFFKASELSLRLTCMKNIFNWINVRTFPWDAKLTGSYGMDGNFGSPAILGWVSILDK